MTKNITVPALGESVSEATVAKWFKAVGDAVAVDEPLVELETDKVTVEVNAEVAGVLGSIAADAGADVAVGALLGAIEEGAKAEAKPGAKPAAKAESKPDSAPAPKAEAKAEPAAKPAPAPQPAASGLPLAPAVRKLIEDNGLDAAAVPATGPGGRLTKGDVAAYLRAGAPAPRAVSQPAQADEGQLPPRTHDPREERVRLSKLRRTIARRLKDAQNTAAMLTTWNDVDMSAAMAMRARYKEKFEKKYGVRLGFMSIFVRAAVVALKELPAVNAELYGEELIYKNYYNIGVAVGSPNGLVVPVLRDADEMSFSGVETAIADFGAKARDGKLSIDEMMGGTFTISNGGVFGSMMSMPILNAPQSAILGMHRIEKRPVAAEDGKTVIVKPMMYLALTYDHRVIDGREAVSFLVRVKQCVEDPERLLIEV
ncbi:MAG: 2-oxoglutarate dehydrogenase complex dihydrolipoyllysine-residue succinyltransferase [Rhodospirillales bacterium]